MLKKYLNRTCPRRKRLHAGKRRGSKTPSPAFTTYLENSLHAYVLELRQQGYIESATALVNNALMEYIKKHFDKSFEE